MWRKALALVVAVATAAAIHRFCWIPYQCGREGWAIEVVTRRALRLTSEFATRVAAQQNVERALKSLERCPHDTALLMLAAVNYRLIGRSADAVRLYERALHNDRRPELHLNLGLSQLDLGQRAEAIQNFVIAADFAGKDILASIDDGDARARAYAIVAQHEATEAAARGIKRRQLIINGRFDLPGPRGRSTADSGSGAAWPSAAASWNTYSSTPTTLTTELVPSTRTPGDTMLHVVTSAADSGLVQLWGDLRRTGVSNVVTTAWIFVRSGRVYAGSGNGSLTVPDVYSTTTGRWERLQGRNGTCPATGTIIYAASGGADFYVDLVDVFEVAGPPCGPE